MMDFEFRAPTRVVFGCGTLSRVGGIAGRLGGERVLVTAGHDSMRRLGLLDKVVGLLEESKLKVFVFDGVTPDPTASEIDDGTEIARKNKCELVVGLGGGSALDAAKAVAVSAGTGEPIRDFIDGPPVDEGALPVIAIPTTAGTGSETSAAAIIRHDKTKIKGGVRGNALFPRVAVVDPALTLTVPRDVTFDTGFDTLAHAIESYISRRASHITDAFAVESMNLIAENLPIVLADGGNIEARTKLSLAATLMGFNIANAGTCAPHRMQYPLAAVAKASHGRALSALIPAWIEETTPHAKKKFGDIAETFGGKNAADSIREFSKKLGYPTRLRDLGVKKDDIKKMAAQVKIKRDTEPREMKVKDVERIYEKAF
jgi:alcohol dehydrogenase